MKIVTLIQTDLLPDTAKRLRDVRTQNRKEVIGTCVMFSSPAPDTLPADIRSIWREAEYLAKLEKSAKTLALLHIRGDLEQLIEKLTKEQAAL